MSHDTVESSITEQNIITNLSNDVWDNPKRIKITETVEGKPTMGTRNTLAPTLITPEQRNNDKIIRLEIENAKLRLRLKDVEQTLEKHEASAAEKQSYQEILDRNRFKDLSMDGVVEDTETVNTDQSDFELIKRSVKRKNSTPYVNKKRQHISDKSDKTNFNNTDSVQTNKRTTKPPPIHIHHQKVKDTLQLVKGIEINDFEIKRVSEDKHSLKTKNIEEYEKVKKLFNEVDTTYFTFTPKDQKVKSIVLKGLTEDEDIPSLKTEIEDKGNVKITNIAQLKTKRSIDENIKLPIYIIQLEPNTNTNLLNKINIINYQRISWEPLHKKREILQCMKCQRFGHAARNCNLKYRCVKCATIHKPGECVTTDKINITEIYCVNCEKKGHPASFKGCPVYQLALNRLKEKIAQKKLNNKQQVWERPIPANMENGTYAEILKNSKEQLTVQKLAAKVEVMAETIKKQSEQIAQLLSILTKF